MLNRYLTCILLFVAVLLAACTPGRSSRPVQGVPLQPSATAAQKIVTLISQTETPPAVQPAAANPLPVFDEKAHATALANLRAVLGDPKLELAYKDLSRSPNAASYPAFWLVDPYGNSYYIRQDTLQPIEFTLERMAQETPGEAKSPDALRAIAEQLARQHSTKWEAVKDRLAFTEGIKGENNFFRWEMQGTDVGGMPAIFQVGLKQDGRLFGYLNSLDFLP